MVLQRHSRADVTQRARERGELAALVAARRQELSLSQQDLADLAGVSTRFVHTLEAGGVDVGLTRLLAVLETLGLHLSLQRGSGTEVVASDVLAQHFGLDPERTQTP